MLARSSIVFLLFVCNVLIPPNRNSLSACRQMGTIRLAHEYYASARAVFDTCCKRAPEDIATSRSPRSSSPRAVLSLSSRQLTSRPPLLPTTSSSRSVGGGGGGADGAGDETNSNSSSSSSITTSVHGVTPLGTTATAAESGAAPSATASSSSSSSSFSSSSVAADVRAYDSVWEALHACHGVLLFASGQVRTMNY